MEYQGAFAQPHAIIKATKEQNTSFKHRYHWFEGSSVGHEAEVLELMQPYALHARHADRRTSWWCSA